MTEARYLLLAMSCAVVACGRPDPQVVEGRGIPHTSLPGIQVPEGMVYVPGGVTHIGSEDGTPMERPVFRAEVAPFFMDRHPVTVTQFREFVEAIGYVTEAERLGDAAVLDLSTGEWRLVAGASWRHPQGPNGPEAPADHPVTQVSWNDAVAFAQWAGKRLPTEVEWEHAARGARDSRDHYAWGDRLSDGPVYHANTFESVGPDGTDRDGHLFTSPVGSYGETVLGLTDMGGNVWEWTADWFRSYAERDLPYTPGAESEKAQRGGSFLCHRDFCHGYRVSGRSHSSPETALFHVGFRLVKDAPRVMALQPCLPDDWPWFSLEYRLPVSETHYRIEVERALPAPGERAYIAVDLRKLHFFQGADGVRLGLAGD